MQRRTLCAAALAATALPSLALSQSGDSPWGLRNILKTPQLSTWTVGEFQAEFSQHQAGHHAFWLYWSEEEPSPGVYDDTELDRGVALTSSVGGNPVIVFQAAARPPTSGGFWAMYGGDPYTGPKDLATEVPPAWPTGLPKGYSPTLYDVTSRIASRIAATYSGTVYMRFHNEAWDLWPLGGGDAWGFNLDNYLRSYLTFRQAIEDVESTTSNPDIEFHVGHGSIPRGRVVPYNLFLIGQGNPEARPAVIQWLDAYTERNRCVVGNVHGIAMPIDTWPEAVTYAGPEGDHNRRLDAWMASFVEWSADGYFEFTTSHPHGKPRFVDLEMFWYDQAVSAAGGTPPPWLAAETAFELLDQEGWGVISCPGAALDQFVAEDYARKWCTLVGEGATFCSPIIGGPHPKYIGLYQPTGIPSSATSCSGGGGCPTLPPPSNCVMNICPFPSNDAFIFLAGQIGAPEGVNTITKNAGLVHYRFDRSSSGRLVDVLWRRSLLDGASPSGNKVVVGPDGASNADVYDVLGNLISSHSGVGQITLTGLGQAPRVVVWT